MSALRCTTPAQAQHHGYIVTRSVSRENVHYRHCKGAGIPFVAIIPRGRLAYVRLDMFPTPHDLTAVAQGLKLDKSAASRRLRAGRERGYLTNLEERRGRPSRYVLGEPLPEESELLPQPCNLAPDKTAGQASGCAVAGSFEGDKRGQSEQPLSVDEAIEVFDAEVVETS